jgi:hypothetical protein
VKIDICQALLQKNQPELKTKAILWTMAFLKLRSKNFQLINSDQQDISPSSCCKPLPNPLASMWFERFERILGHDCNCSWWCHLGARDFKTSVYTKMCQDVPVLSRQLADEYSLAHEAIEAMAM